MTHTIQVCIRCNFTKTAEEKEGKRGGAQLYDNLLKKIEKWSLKDEFAVEPTRCMGACGTACVVAFRAPGKISWVFGNLNPRFSVRSLLEFAEKYHADPEGKVPYAERPPEMAAGLVARLYPEQASAVAAVGGDADCA